MHYLYSIGHSGAKFSNQLGGEYQLSRNIQYPLSRRSLARVITILEDGQLSSELFKTIAVKYEL